MQILKSLRIMTRVLLEKNNSQDYKSLEYEEVNEELIAVSNG